MNLAFAHEAAAIESFADEEDIEKQS